MASSDEVSRPEHPKIAWLAERFETIPHKNCSRGEFYEFHKIVISAWYEQGTQKTIEDVARLVDVAISPALWREIATEHKSTLSHLKRIANASPNSFLDDALNAVSDGRLGCAIRTIGRLHNEPVRGINKLHTMIDEGPDQGLAIWQVINPFYFLWLRFPALRSPVYEKWSDTQFDNETDNLAVSKVARDPNRILLRDILNEHFKSSFWASAKVLEGGCGHGDGAAFLLDEMGMSAWNYSGFDLHEKRVESVRQLITKRIEQKPSPIVPKCRQGHIFKLDILNSAAPSILAEVGAVDVLYMASFTNVFDDQTLSIVLARLSKLRPKLIVDLSAITTWALCFGRINPKAIYEAMGYQMIASRFEHPQILSNEAHRLWIPERYWSNRRIFLFTPLDPASQTDH